MAVGRSASAWDAERPDGIPPERVPIGRGTSIIDQDFFDKTLVFQKSFVPSAQREMWYKTFLDGYTDNQ